MSAVMHMLVTILERIAVKTGDVFQHIGAWLAAAGLFVVSVLAPHGFILNLVLAVTLADAVWGISVSLKRGAFALSELMRLTVGKLAVYGCALFGFAGLDMYVQMQTGLEVSVTTAVLGVVIVLVELWSSCASMLILFPKFPFLCLLKRMLTGEIARKLGMAEEEVDNFLTNGNDRCK